MSIFRKSLREMFSESKEYALESRNRGEDQDENKSSFEDEKENLIYQIKILQDEVALLRAVLRITLEDCSLKNEHMEELKIFLNGASTSFNPGAQRLPGQKAQDQLNPHPHPQLQQGPDQQNFFKIKKFNLFSNDFKSKSNFPFSKSNINNNNTNNSLCSSKSVIVPSVIRPPRPEKEKLNFFFQNFQANSLASANPSGWPLSVNQNLQNDPFSPGSSSILISSSSMDLNHISNDDYNDKEEEKKVKDKLSDEYLEERAICLVTKENLKAEDSEKTTKKNLFSSVPFDLLFNFFSSYFTSNDLCIISCVDKNFLSLCGLDSIWRKFFLSRWDQHYHIKSVSWKHKITKPFNMPINRSLFNQTNYHSQHHINKENNYDNNDNNNNNSTKNDYCFDLSNEVYNKYLLESRSFSGAWKEAYIERSRVDECWTNPKMKPNILTLAGHQGTVTSLALSNNGQLIFSGSDDGSIIAHSPAYLTNRANQSNNLHNNCNLIQQHHKSSKIFEKWNSYLGHGGPVWCVDVDFANDLLVSGSYDKTIKIWSLKNAHTLSTLRGHSSWVSSVHLRDDNILSASWDATVKLWKFDKRGINKKNFCSQKLEERDFNSLSSESSETSPLSPSNNTRSPINNLSPHHNNSEDKHDLNYSCVSTLSNPAGDVIYSTQWDTLSNKVIAGCRNSAIRVWDLTTSVCVDTLIGHKSQVYCVEMEKEKNLIFSGSGDHSIKIWDGKTSKCEISIDKAHTNSVMALQFYDNKIVSGGYDKVIKVWDLRAIERGPIRSLEGHSAGIFSIRFDLDKIISGAADKNIIVWDFNKF